MKAGSKPTRWKEFIIANTCEQACNWPRISSASSSRLQYLSSHLTFGEVLKLWNELKSAVKGKGKR